MKQFQVTNQKEKTKKKDICSICKKREVQIYQLDYEVCCECHDNETYVRFIDYEPVGRK
jgi:hypothetical protein